jgi:endonuclease-3
MARPRGAQARAAAVVELLAKEYPDVRCALDHTNAFELLEATILSAQCTDERVNMVTPTLFARYPTPRDLAHADPAEVEEIVKSTGFFRAKTKSLIGMATAVDERYGGEVPRELDDLVTVPGVGRKTGNVVRSVAYDLPGLPVDTHVTRLSRLLGLTKETDPVKIEHDLNAMVPPEEWGNLSLRLIEHGRRVCIARKPRCDACVLNHVCPSAFKVGPPPKKAATAKKATAAKKAAKTIATKEARGGKRARG